MTHDSEKTILRTLIFFDLLDYPLTLFEIWKCACVLEGAERIAFSEVVDFLHSASSLRERVGQCDGVYTLAGRGGLSDIRREGTVYADQKYRIAQKMARIFSWFPFVRMVCACNTVGLGAAKKSSDVDLFIVARANHLWFVRLLCTGYVHVLGRRPRGNVVRDTLCLSFYAGDDALNFSSVANPPIQGVPDIYFLYWITWCVPIYDDGVYEVFFTENAWVQSVLPNRIPFLPAPHRRVVLSRFARAFKSSMEHVIDFFGSLVELGSRGIQRLLMPRSITSKIGQGTGVIVSDSLLKFHITDRRHDIQEEFLRRCKEMNI
ncbi:MAG: hypothetical protein Q8P56_05905 [Candidatus Uhrbacteria bacterium]|nr:hypothetical protein [Candidatus Uhrbacteria bacterium]